MNSNLSKPFPFLSFSHTPPTPTLVLPLANQYTTSTGLGAKAIQLANVVPGQTKRGSCAPRPSELQMAGIQTLAFPFFLPPIIFPTFFLPFPFSHTPIHPSGQQMTWVKPPPARVESTSRGAPFGVCHTSPLCLPSKF